MTSSEPNPYLHAALESVAPREAPDDDQPDVKDNLISGTDFATSGVLKKNDPAECYNPVYLRSIYGQSIDQPHVIEQARVRLRQYYGKDFNSVTWRQQLRLIGSSAATPQATDLLRSESGALKPVLANAMIVMRQAGIKLAVDEFAGGISFMERPPWETGAVWQDIDDTFCTEWLQHKGVTINTTTANQAATLLARDHRIHPVRDWLTALKWDGEPRTESWLTTLLGVPDTRYAQLVGDRWLIQAVSRIMNPGCKAESVLILEGPEGTYKSTALRALTNGHLDSNSGVQWFSDSLPSIDHDEIAMHLQGIWIFEIAELEAIRGKAWTNTKKFFSIQRDRFRAKYGRNVQSVSRQQVFAASTNESKWAGDPTGARRFWPVKPGKIDVDRLLAVRDQLWAEAVFKFNEGTIFHFPSDERDIAKSEQSQRYEEDIWTRPVSRWLAAACMEMSWTGSIGADEILAGACGMNRSYQQRADGFRLGIIMRRLGWESVAGEHGEVWKKKGED